jgi:ribosome-binding factor A
MDYMLKILIRRELSDEGTGKVIIAISQLLTAVEDISASKDLNIITFYVKVSVGNVEGHGSGSDSCFF